MGETPGGRRADYPASSDVTTDNDVNDRRHLETMQVRDISGGSTLGPGGRGPLQNLAQAL